MKEYNEKVLNDNEVKVLNNEIEDDIPFIEEKFDEETLQDMKDAQEGNITSPLKAIKLFCIDCCGGSFQEVKKCPCKKCPLYNFRVGKKMVASERKKREMSEERKEMLRRNVAKAQAARKAKREMNKG